MTLATFITFLRIPLLFIVVLCTMLPEPGFATAALVAFVIAVATDWLDGFVARQLKQESHVGALMDALVDKIFVLGLFFYFLNVRIIPEWGTIPLLIILSREFIITGLRQCALLKNKVIAAESQGKIKTVLQFLSLLFLVLVSFYQRDMGGTPDMLALADFFKFFGRLTFALAAVLTITSGFYYLRRYSSVLVYDPSANPEAIPAKSSVG